MAEDTQQCVRDDVNVCQLCGELEHLSVCGACKSAWYCSKTHQRQDWKKHKRICKRAGNVDENYIGENNGVVNNNGNGESKSVCMFTSTSEQNISSENVSRTSLSSVQALANTPTDSLEACCKTTERNLTQLPKNCELKRSTRKKEKSLKKDSLTNNSQQQRFYLDQTSQLCLPPSVSELSTNQKQNSKSEMGREESFSNLESKEQYLLILQSRFNEVAKYVVKCLTRYGICVVDKFLGDATAQDIFQEVMQLKASGIMNQGQLVNGASSSSSQNKDIRGDIITWVDGSEATCKNIHYLISCMDTVMLQGMSNLENCTINERTKAMVACYPGGGRGYVRHVDNPSGDGRCVTCIYYLNKDWNVKDDGGLLRIYPEGLDQVANIEPVCDRLLFFWSDRRNPHEVEKALRERFAITVWYYDADERAEALKRLKDEASNITNRSSSTSPNNS